MEITNPHLVNHINLFVEFTYYDRQQRIDLHTSCQNKFCQSINKCGSFESSNNGNNGTNITSTSIVLGDRDSQLTKGFFIEGSIDKIDNLRLSLNGHDRLVYNKLMISRYCKKISDKLVYLPFCVSNNYKDMTVDSYIGSTNLSVIDTTRINLHFSSNFNDKSDNYLNIYTVSMKYLVYHGGLGWTNYTPVTNLPPIDIPTSVNNPQPVNNSQPINISNEWETQQGTLRIEDEIMCPITYELINDDYCLCTTCNNAFGHTAIRRWLNTRSTCPLCRSSFTNRIRYTMNNQSINSDILANADMPVTGIPVTEVPVTGISVM